LEEAELYSHLIPVKPKCNIYQNRSIAAKFTKDKKQVEAKKVLQGDCIISGQHKAVRQTDLKLRSTLKSIMKSHSNSIAPDVGFDITSDESFKIIFREK